MDDKKNKSVPLASINRVVRGSEIQDVYKLLNFGSRESVYEAYRRALFIDAVAEIDIGVSQIEKYVQFSFFKFLAVSIAFFATFSAGYHFFRLDAVKSLYRWGVLGNALLGLILGGFFCNIFDLGVVQIIYRRLLNNEVGYNLMADFYALLTFSQKGDAGAWKSPEEVVAIINEKKGRVYDTMEVSQFLDAQPYTFKKDKKGTKLYFLAYNNGVVF